MLEVFMFINICWKRDGEVKKSCVHIDKLFPMVKEIESQGVKTWFEVSK